MKKKSPSEQENKSTKLGEAVVQIPKRDQCPPVGRQGNGWGEEEIFSKVREAGKVPIQSLDSLDSALALPLALQLLHY